jgi:hypothetical protein
VRRAGAEKRLVAIMKALAVALLGVACAGIAGVIIGFSFIGATVVYEAIRRRYRRRS